MNCVTSLFAWWGCAQLLASSDLFCSVYFFENVTHHSCCTWSFHQVLPLTLAVCTCYGLRRQLCYGCNTTVIFMMKRIIYFLMTSNNQEVLPLTEFTAFILCHWNGPSRRKLWCRQAEARRQRSDFYYRYFPIRHVMSCGCVKDSICVPVLC